MRIETKPALIFVVSLAVAAAAVFYAIDHWPDRAEHRAGYGHDRTPGAAPVPPATDQQRPEGADQGMPRPDSSTAEDRTSRPARANRDQAARPAAAAPGRSPFEIDWANEFEARAVLESALEGDRDDTISVAELASRCRAVPVDESQVRASLAHAARGVERGQPLPGLFIEATGETVEFTDYAEYENRTLTQFEQCRVARGLFDGSLRDRLVQLARSGSATARYLYAMWLPDQGAGDVDQMIDWITYQSLAMEFTWQNIRDGEPLGLLAYGRSLEQVGNVYFTPVQKRYGPAFILAARKCGLDNALVNSKIANMTGQWKDRDMIQSIGTAEDLSDAIVRLVCP